MAFLLGSGVGPALAQESSPLLVVRSDRSDAAARWRSRLRGLGLAGHDSLTPRQRPFAIAPERLASLARVEALLAQARAEAADLAEGDALSSLAQAAALVDDLGDVPGAAMWQAEVQLQIGVTAGQAGLTQLAEDAFRRTTTLDPGRRLRQAEAPPAVVAQFERAARGRALSAAGAFDVRASVAGAAVYLDDALQGAAPVRVRAVVGRHVLRVEAAGHQPYGASIDILEGERPALDIALAPAPALDATNSALQLAAAGRYPLAAAPLSRLERAGERAPTLYALEVSTDAQRALLVRCRPDGCRGPLRLSDANSEQSLAAALATSQWFEPARMNDARNWLGAGDPASHPWWGRWYVWSGAAALTVAVTTAAVVLGNRPEPPRQLHVVVAPPR